VVPDDFQTVLGNREGDGLLEVLQAVAAANQLGLRGVAGRRVVDVLRHGGAATGLVHRQPVAVRVTLEHGDLAGREVGFVLLVVLRGDGELRLVAGIGIADEAIGRNRGGILRQTASPGGNGACRITSLLGADRGQFAAQACRLGLGYRGHGAAGQQRKG